MTNFFRTMQFAFTFVFIHWLVAACHSQPEASLPAAQSKAAAHASPPADLQPEFQMKPDTIEVRGRFLAGCTMPSIIKIAEHNELSSPWKEVPVSPSGEFKYRMYLPEPRRIAMRTEKRAAYDFMALTTHPVYEIEVNCATGLEKLELKNTNTENTAYRPFSNANKKFRERLDSVGKLDLTKPEVFARLKTIVSDYQNTLSGIVSSYPETFTAKVLCAAEKLPEESLNSLDALRKNFLRREAFANPYIYNDFLGGRIIANYLSLCDRTADQTEIIEWIMNTASKNQDAAKRLQQVTYNVFYNRHEEELLMSFIKWAEANPALVYNSSVKGALSRLNKVMPGRHYLEIQLNDPSGAPRKLSDAVKSGRLTLLVFYSPTCDHCQAEVPQLKPLWEQYKSKGLKVYIVGFDATTDEWNAFIKTKASAEWTHVFDHSQNVSYQYVVNYTPTYILINQQGEIITRMAVLDDVKNDIPKILN